MPAPADLSNWPLEDLVSGHVFTKVMNCNWKIFWENFNECLHCPGVHKHLSHLVPIYGRGLMAPPRRSRLGEACRQRRAGVFRRTARRRRDVVRGRPLARAAVPGPDRAGARRRPDLCATPAVDVHRRPCRLCAHGRLLPLGPEQTKLTAEWLFPPQEMPPAGLDNIVAFGRQVLEEDAAVCELNQRGLHSRRHKAGVLMPEEYELHRFHRWVRRAARKPSATSTSADSAR